MGSILSNFFGDFLIFFIFTRPLNTPSHNLCGSCDLASKLNYVTGDELDIDVSIELFRNQTILRWCRCFCGYSSYASILIW